MKNKRDILLSKRIKGESISYSQEAFIEPIKAWHLHQPSIESKPKLQVDCIIASKTSDNLDTLQVPEKSLLKPHVTVEGRNQTLFTLCTFEKKKFEKQKFLL